MNFFKHLLEYFRTWSPPHVQLQSPQGPVLGLELQSVRTRCCFNGVTLVPLVSDGYFKTNSLRGSAQLLSISSSPGSNSTSKFKVGRYNQVSWSIPHKIDGHDLVSVCPCKTAQSQDGLVPNLLQEQGLF